MKLDLEEWMEVGNALRAASPGRFAEILQTLKQTADAASLIASHEESFFMRNSRKAKRYLA